MKPVNALRTTTAILTAAAVLASCNDYPVHRLLDSFEVRVTDRLSQDKPVKLDFLWVIDQSASMCQEQRALSSAFDAFLVELNKLGAIDAQMAVVTAQQAPDKSAIKVVGRFMHTPAKAFPPNCIERVRMPCFVKGHCVQPLQFKHSKVTDASMCAPQSFKTTPAMTDSKGKSQGKWECKGPQVTSHASNLNCSLNSYCESRCDPKNKNKDCESLFGKGAECKVPGGSSNTDNAGCMFPPETSDCPPADKLPSIVRNYDANGDGKHDPNDPTDNTINLFKCIATVGAAQTPESKFEGSFRSAWFALDKEGPNCSYDACIKSLRRCCLDGGAWCAKDKSGTASGGKCASEIKSLCEPLKDPKNCQATQLLRDDAYLVLVFISDDDDCSMKVGLNPLDKKVITKEVWEDCQLHGDSLGGNVALNEGNCEFKREKARQLYDIYKNKGDKKGMDSVANVWCPSDCEPGSAAKTLSGSDKCPKGCKVTCFFDKWLAAQPKGSDGKALTKKQLEDAFKADYSNCPPHFRADSAERGTCLQNAYEDIASKTKKNKVFAPVDEYVTMFKKLKSDPAKVIVAAISGDAISVKKDKAGKLLPLTARQQHRDRVNYYRSQLKDQGPGQAPYVCAGARGESNFGGRYIAMVDAFRDNGTFYNVCQGDDAGSTDFGPALVRIARTILKRTTKICLPQPPYMDDKKNPIVKVTRKRGASEQVLEYNSGCDETKPNTFCIKPDNDCRAGKTNLVGVNAKCNVTRDCTSGLTCIDGICQIYSAAIFFPVVQEPGDEIEVNFEADLGL